MNKINAPGSMRRITLFGAILASASVAAAQTVAPSSSPDQAADEEVVELSPFEVSSERDTGYQTTDTLAGTRLRTSLRDVGSAISVVTKELMSDIGATDNTTLLQYTTNTEVSGTRSTYAGVGNGSTVDESNRLLAPNTVNRVRGLSAAENTRDFFVSDIPWDSYNIDRVDLQRGPNSILFGLGKPAGIINASLAGAAFVDDNNVVARFGSYGSYRGSVSINKEIIDNVLAFRFAALADREKFMQDPAFEDDDRYYLALRFDPKLSSNGSMRTSIKLKYEHGDIDANRPRTITPMDSVSPWFRPSTVSASNPFGGLNKVLVSDPYTAFRDYQGAAGPNYNPWIGGGGSNAQQPMWMVDGATGDVYAARANFINNGARTSTGAVLTTSSSISGKLYDSPFLGINTLTGNVPSQLNLPLANYGQYRAQSMTDSGIFDFYEQLIDGPNKWEWENWDAYNIDLSQTFLNDRLGIQVIYDNQDYTRGGESLLGWQPTIQVDLLQNWADFTANPNAGRAFVTATNGGDGRSYHSEREYYRASLFGELRATDLFKKENFLTKLLGKHRLNGVYSKEDYKTENLTWIRKANDQAWAGYWNANAGNTSPFYDRGPLQYLYLGNSLTSLSSASDAHLPGITANVDLQSGSVRVFDSIWNAPSDVAFDAPWTVPESLAPMFNATPPQEAGYMQNSNPANYVGWNNHAIGIMSYDRGADPRLTRRAQLSQRETTSKALSWQAFLWDGAIVATVGWREDEVKSRYNGAVEDRNNRLILNLSPDQYRLPDSYDPARVLKDNSTSGGVVVHINKFFEKDPLPIKVSLTYNDSSNFEVTDVRNDLYGNPIPNPTGSTKDYGILLATKDGKYSFRALKYESEVMGGSSSLSSGGIGSTISNGLNWRNVYLYQLGAYDWGTRDSRSYRNHSSNAYPIPTDGSQDTRPWHVADGSAEEMALDDAMVSGWNQIQAWLNERGFFQAWGMNPVDLADLTTKSVYQSNPAAHTPSDTSKVYSYTATAPQNFAVTADTLSKGYEFEFTANPTNSWRITFNASKTEASYNNVGGTLINEFVEFMDSMLLDTAGTAHGPGYTDGNGVFWEEHSNGYTPAGNLPRWGGAGNAIGPSIYAAWRADYVRMKLQEGTSVPEFRKWRFNVVSNYSFRTGALKGVGVGGSYRWQDKVAIGYPLVPEAEGPLYTFDINSPIWGPSEDAIDLWASYERRIFEKVKWKVQLNVRNAFASKGLIPISVEPDNETWASVRTKPVQEWFLTNTFSF